MLKVDAAQVGPRINPQSQFENFSRDTVPLGNKAEPSLFIYCLPDPLRPTQFLSSICQENLKKIFISINFQL